MQRHIAALPFVRDLDLEAEDIAELTLERVEVGIGGLGRIARARPPDVGARPRPPLFAPRPLLCLPDREAPGDDLARQFLWVVRGGNSPCVTHTDIALQ